MSEGRSDDVCGWVFGWGGVCGAVFAGGVRGGAAAGEVERRFRGFRPVTFTPGHTRTDIKGRKVEAGRYLLWRQGSFVRVNVIEDLDAGCLVVCHGAGVQRLDEISLHVEFERVENGS